MLHRRNPWDKLTRAGIPALVVSRPIFDLMAGAPYPAPVAGDKVALRRMRQLYEQRRLDVAAVSAAAPTAAAPTAAPVIPALQQNNEKRRGR